jgi:hypothetical protein
MKHECLIHVLEPESTINIDNTLDELDTHHEPSFQKRPYRKLASLMSLLQTAACISLGSLDKRPREQ